MMTTPTQGADPAVFDRASKDALSAVAVMYRECHAEAPDSELCGALQDIQKAIAEIHARKSSGQGASPPQNMDEAASQLHAATMADAQGAGPQIAPGGGY